MNAPVPRPPLSGRAFATQAEVLVLTTGGDTRADVLTKARELAITYFGHEQVALRNARIKQGNPHTWTATRWWASTRLETQP